MSTRHGSDDSAASPSGEPGPVNEVRLRGRVSAVADPRILPSGDAVVSLRVVVPRDRPEGTGRVDVIDVACWSARTRGVASRLAEGDEVEVRGALRRRFFRTGSATQSRYEVEAGAVVRCRRATRRRAG